MSETESAPQQAAPPPPASGVRVQWAAVPGHVRGAVEEHLGARVTEAESQASGFSPGVAARLRLADGRRVFLKAVSPAQNEQAVQFHRREARIAAALPSATPAPRLLWSFDDEAQSPWVVLVFEDIEGRHPAQPWQADEVERVMGALDELNARLTPSPLPRSLAGAAADMFEAAICGWRKLRDGDGAQIARLDPWSARHVRALAAIEAQVAAAADGDTLLHFDVRADNILLGPDRVWFVDWPHACTGAAWVDAVALAPSVAMQGGPAPAALLARCTAARSADPEAITTVVVAMAGFFLYQSLQPAPAGLPTLRAFQAAQGAVARQWAAERLGWD